MQIVLQVKSKDGKIRKVKEVKNLLNNISLSNFELKNGGKENGIFRQSTWKR